MNPFDDVLTRFEMKYFNAPRSYEIVSREDFRNMLKEQPWETEARKNKKFLYAIYKLLSFLVDTHTWYRRCIIALRYMIKPTNKIKFKYVPSTYVEIDHLLFLTTFELFGRYIETEKPFEVIEATEDNRALLQVMQELYDWWVKRRAMNASDAIWGQEYDALYKEETANLIKLIEIRGFLWC
jgi:hypothetical protein